MKNYRHSELSQWFYLLFCLFGFFVCFYGVSTLQPKMPCNSCRLPGSCQKVAKPALALEFAEQTHEDRRYITRGSTHAEFPSDCTPLLAGLSLANVKAVSDISA